MFLVHCNCHSMESKTDWKANHMQIITSSFIVVHIDSLQLQITVSMVTASGVNPMLITDDLPKLEIKKKRKNHVMA